MKISTSQSEGTLAELTKRLFEIKGRRATERVHDAEAALLRANPHLRKMKTIPEGTPLLVPDLPETERKQEPASPAGGKQAVRQLRQVLKAVREKLEADVQRDMDSLKELTQTLKAKEVTALVRQSGEIKTRLGEIKTNVKTRSEEAQSRKAEQKANLAEIEKNLDVFLQRFSL